MKYKQCIQAGNNVNDILKLPCVVAVRKTNKGQFEYELSNGIYLAYEGDWICQDESGDWTVISDETHRFLTERQRDIVQT